MFLLKKKRSEEIIFLIKKIYACYKEKDSKETLLLQLEKLKKMSIKQYQCDHLYEEIVREILAASAGDDDMETFLWILDHAGSAAGFCRITKKYVYSNEEIAELKEEIPGLCESTFVTEKEEFLDEIVKRIGISHMGNVEQKWYQNVELPYALPEAYIAVLSGNMKMTEYFRSRNGYGRGIIEWTDTDDEEEQWKYRMNREAKDILTVALMSGSERMTEYILQNFSDLPWNMWLEHEILKADRALGKLVWKFHPEVCEFLSCHTIFIYRNGFFMERYLESSAKNGFLAGRRLLDYSQLEELPLTMQQTLIREGKDSEVLYDKALSVLQNPEDRKFLLHELFADYLQCRKENLLDLFLKYRDAEHDFTEYLYEGYVIDHLEESCSGYIILCDLVEQGKTEPFPINIHAVSQIDFFSVLGKKEWKRIFHALIPIQDGAVEFLNTALLIMEKKDVSFLGLAIQKGFFSENVISKLLTEQKQLSLKRDQVFTLMKAGGQRKLTERYEL